MACETYHILMRVHEDEEAVILGHPEDLDGVLDPFLIVDARAAGLDSLPGEDITDCVVAKAFQARKVDVCMFSREWPGMELYAVPIEEVIAVLGRLVGRARVLCVAGDVDPA